VESCPQGELRGTCSALGHHARRSATPVQAQRRALTPVRQVRLSLDHDDRAAGAAARRRRTRLHGDAVGRRNVIVNVDLQRRRPSSPACRSEASTPRSPRERPLPLLDRPRGCGWLWIVAYQYAVPQTHTTLSRPDTCCAPAGIGGTESGTNNRIAVSAGCLPHFGHRRPSVAGNALSRSMSSNAPTSSYVKLCAANQAWVITTIGSTRRDYYTMQIV
jgi:hypothetical protein